MAQKKIMVLLTFTVYGFWSTFFQTILITRAHVWPIVVEAPGLAVGNISGAPEVQCASAALMLIRTQTKRVV